MVEVVSYEGVSAAEVQGTADWTGWVSDLMLKWFAPKMVELKGLGSNANDSSCSKTTSPEAAAAAMAAHVFPLT